MRKILLGVVAAAALATPLALAASANAAAHRSSTALRHRRQGRRSSAPRLAEHERDARRTKGRTARRSTFAHRLRPDVQRVRRRDRPSAPDVTGGPKTSRTGTPPIHLRHDGRAEPDRGHEIRTRRARSQRQVLTGWTSPARPTRRGRRRPESGSDWHRRRRRGRCAELVKICVGTRHREVTARPRPARSHGSTRPAVTRIKVHSSDTSRRAVSSRSTADVAALVRRLSHHRIHRQQPVPLRRGGLSPRHRNETRPLGTARVRAEHPDRGANGPTTALIRLPGQEAKKP